jgi:hypothetical protein
MNSPYLCEKEIEKRNLLENKKKIIGNDKLKMGKPEINFISNYVYETISEPAANYKSFRTENREKWLQGKNFRL